MNKTQQLLTVFALGSLTVGAIVAAPVAEKKKETTVAAATKTIELNVKGMM